MNIEQGTPNTELAAALNILRKGGTLLYPTDTIWGIGCDAANEDAVNKIFQIKKREEGKSLIILIDDAAKLNRYVKEIPEIAWDLVDFSEHPLTIIYPGAIHLAKNVAADDGSVGIRITKDPFCRELIRRFGKPIVSTSANLSGSTPPLTFSEIDPLILSAVDYVVNLQRGENFHPHRTPSSILKLGLRGEIQIIRKS